MIVTMATVEEMQATPIVYVKDSRATFLMRASGRMMSIMNQAIVQRLCLPPPSWKTTLYPAVVMYVIKHMAKENWVAATIKSTMILALKPKTCSAMPP